MFIWQRPEWPRFRQDTANGDIRDPIDRGILVRDRAGGRSTGYELQPLAPDERQCAPRPADSAGSHRLTVARGSGPIRVPEKPSGRQKRGPGA